MNSIFSNILDESLLVYLDDELILLFTNIELHYDNICKTLEWFHENSLKAKVRKCVFATTKVEYLGYIVENGKIAMDPE